MVRFGPFAIDTRTWTLSREGVALDLSPRLVEILAYLVERDGATATKGELLDRFWPDVHVTENTLTRAIADIRKALDDSPDRPTVIQTLARRGYRFVGTAGIDRESEDPFRRWVSGRLALESLDPSRLADARLAMDAAATAMPDYAPAQAGVANAHLVSFETTRAGNRPDFAALESALHAAHRAVGLDPRLGEAWAVLGHAQALAGRHDEAQASARRAVALEADNWRHHFRLALVSWGEERLRAADRALGLLPSCAAAHLLSAMVFVARGAWDRAEAAAIEGARLQDAQLTGTRLPAAGLHWMHGLVLGGRARLGDAASAMARETEDAAIGLYATEFRWLAQSCLGFLHLHEGERERAAAAFTAAEGLNPGAARGVLGLHLSGACELTRVDRALEELVQGRKASDAVLVHAGLLAWTGRAPEALGMLQGLLREAPPGPTAWNLAADPMFLPLHPDARLRPLLAALAIRAA